MSPTIKSPGLKAQRKLCKQWADDIIQQASVVEVCSEDAEDADSDAGEGIDPELKSIIHSALTVEETKMALMLRELGRDYTEEFRGDEPSGSGKKQRLWVEERMGSIIEQTATKSPKKAAPLLAEFCEGFADEFGE